MRGWQEEIGFKCSGDDGFVLVSYSDKPKCRPNVYIQVSKIMSLVMIEGPCDWNLEPRTYDVKIYSRTCNGNTAVRELSFQTFNDVMEALNLLSSNPSNRCKCMKKVALMSA